MRDEFTELMETVARRLLGEPNNQLSTKDELRYGKKGSLSIDLNKGVFYDHESGQGGGVLELIKREVDGDPVKWLRSERLIGSEHIDASFDYRAENGDLMFQVCRTAEKKFWQRRPDGAGGWINSIKGVRRVPYRLPELISGAGAVFVPEGEKHVDALCRLGLRATCNPGGAGKWRPEYSEFLRDADVVILPDYDPPGQSHAANVARSLQGIASRVRIVALPNLKPKGDVIDWLNDGGDKDELLRLVDETPVWQAVKQQSEAGNSATLGVFLRSAADLQKQTFEPLHWIVPEYLPEGLTLLAGKPKMGKSFWALDVAIAVSSGGSCLGKQCQEGDVLALLLEDSDRRLQRRLTTMLGARVGQWPTKLTYATEWPLLENGGIDRIKDWIGLVKDPRLIIVDILERVRPRDKSKQTSQYSADYAALTSLQKLAADAQLSILVLHHQRKMDAEDLIDTISGTLGLGGVVDTILILGQDNTGKFLYGRGRDLEEFVVAMSQDSRCRWQVLGSKPDSQASPERGKIVAVLAQAQRHMTVDEIAGVARMKKANVKVLLSKLHHEGEIERVARGIYKLPNPQSAMDLGEECGR